MKNMIYIVYRMKYAQYQIMQVYITVIQLYLSTISTFISVSGKYNAKSMKKRGYAINHIDCIARYIIIRAVECITIDEIHTINSFVRLDPFLYITSHIQCTICTGSRRECTSGRCTIIFRDSVI